MGNGLLTYNELIELREKLANGEIALEHAKKLFWNGHKEGKRSWHTKDWKERRSKVIKDKCEICGSIEILTLQHRSHPKKYIECEREITRKYSQLHMESSLIIDKNEISEHITRNYNYAPIPLCPNCKSRHPNKRTRKSPHYLCTKCRHEFDEPFYKSAVEIIDAYYENEEATEVSDKCFVSKDKWRNRHNLSQVKYWLLREMAKAENIEVIKKEAFLLYLDENIKYLSFEDTITACRKCAYQFDLKDMELCPKCKKYYKGVQHPTCIQCLPEEKRNAALEKIEYGKELQGMHEELGID